MDRADVVTVFLRHDGEVLLLKRVTDAETYPGSWGTVTGYIEHEDAEDSARMEIHEETGLDNVVLARRGEPFTVPDASLDREWQVHPFLFDAFEREVQLNEETERAEWTTPTAIRRRPTVPDLWHSYDRVRPTPNTIGTDDEHGSAYISLRALEVLRDEAGLAATSERDFDTVRTVASELLAARPSMAALRNRVNRVMAAADTANEVEDAAISEIEDAIEADRTAARLAKETVSGHVLTHSRSGTVFDALRIFGGEVTVAESRPAREGIDVAEMLATEDISVRICTDAAMGHVLGSGEVDTVLVGADTVLPDGRVLNKTGTRSIAILADREDVPCYVVTASDKISTDETVHLESGPTEVVYDGSAEIEVINPTFDVTPAEYVTAVITERGKLAPADIRELANEFRSFTVWQDQP